MAEDENDLDSAAEQSAEQADTPNETFRSVEDSIAITRTKGAYQPDNKRYTQALKEKKVPQRVIAAQMNQVDPLTEDDIDDETLIAPSRQIIGTAYRDTAKPEQVPAFRPVVAESSAGDDTLSLASTDNRNVQTVSFKVKGIQWRAGFADTLANTPLGHAIHPSPLPGYKDEIPESLKKAGIVIRPVNPRLRVVLNQLLPPDFRKKVSQQRKKTDRMKLLAIFYLPGTPSSHVGFIHEFMGSKSNYRFYLYIQTSVGKAPVAILDEVLKTLEAGLPEGEKASDLDEYEVAEEEQDVPEVEFDFSGEVQQAMKQAGDTLNNSIVVYGAKQANRVVRDWSLEMIRVVDRVVARFIRGMTWVLVQLANSPLIRALAASTQFLSKIFVQFIWGLNKVLLGVARSPITKAIFENIVRVFKILGRLFLLIWFGIQWVFQSAIAIGAYFANAVRPGSMNMPTNSIQFPSFGQGMFGGQKSSSGKTSKKSQDANAKKNQITANKTTAAKRRLPPPKPVKKQGAIPALPGTIPVGPRNKNLPPPPGLKPGEPLSAEAKAAKQRELGYFEDQAF